MTERVDDYRERARESGRRHVQLCRSDVGNKEIARFSPDGLRERLTRLMAARQLGKYLSVARSNGRAVNASVAL